MIPQNDKLQLIREKCIAAHGHDGEKPETHRGYEISEAAEIRLADVLLAIEKFFDGQIGVCGDGTFEWWKSPDQGGGHWEVGEKWNLREDDLEKQSEETIYFIHTLLKK